MRCKGGVLEESEADKSTEDKSGKVGWYQKKYQNTINNSMVHTCTYCSRILFFSSASLCLQVYPKINTNLTSRGEQCCMYSTNTRKKNYSSRGIIPGIIFCSFLNLFLNTHLISGTLTWLVGIFHQYQIFGALYNYVSLQII